MMSGFEGARRVDGELLVSDHVKCTAQAKEKTPLTLERTRVGRAYTYSAQGTDTRGLTTSAAHLWTMCTQQ